MPKGLRRFYGAGEIPRLRSGFRQRAQLLACPEQPSPARLTNGPAKRLHFITCSCYRRLPILCTPLRRDLFLTILEQVRQRYRFVVVGYVVMPEHFHLLMAEPERGTPSTVLQVLKQRFARRLHCQARSSSTSRRLWAAEEVAQVWQERFYDFNVWTKKKEVEKLRYMHRNPVQRGLVAEPDHWPWSSFRSYAYGEPGRVRINSQEWPLEIKRMAARRPPTGESVPALSQRTRKNGARQGFS